MAAILLLLIPALEIYSLIWAIADYGFWPILTWILLAVFIGFRIVQHQGFKVLTALQKRVALGQDPQMELLQGVVILFGGILLIIPGFITDLLSLFCLIPITRRVLARQLSHWILKRAAKGRVRVYTNFGFRHSRPNTPHAEEVHEKPIKNINSPSDI